MKRRPKKKTGRPRLELSGETVQRLARRGMTIADVADVLGCSRDTIERNYRDEYERGVGQMRGRLRAKQVKLALNGNVIMLIWLGKQLLAQREPDKASAPPPTAPDKPYPDDVPTSQLEAAARGKQAH